MKFLDLHGVDFRAFYLKFLAEANEIEVRTIVEIGVWQGKNASVLRQLFPAAHLYLIDPWQPVEAYFLNGGAISQSAREYEGSYQQVKKLFENDEKVSILRMPSTAGAQKVPDGMDLVFIDGDHSYDYVKEDITTWQKKVRKGGLLCGHDYSPKFPGVMRAVNECLPGKFAVGKDTVWASIA